MHGNLHGGDQGRVTGGNALDAWKPVCWPTTAGGAEWHLDPIGDSEWETSAVGRGQTCGVGALANMKACLHTHTCTHMHCETQRCCAGVCRHLGLWLGWVVGPTHLRMPPPQRRARPLALSIGGVSKKARKNRYQYRLVIPDKGIYRAERSESKAFWMWQERDSGHWFAGEENVSMTPESFDDSNVDVLWMCTEVVVRPGPHNWHSWDDSKDDWLEEAYEFTTEVADCDWEEEALPAGAVLAFGWYNPDAQDDDDVMETGTVEVAPAPLSGIWTESDAAPPPPPPWALARRVPRPPPPPPLSTAAPTTPPEAFLRPGAASSASSASSSLGAVPESRWGRRSNEDGPL